MPDDLLGPGGHLESKDVKVAFELAQDEDGYPPDRWETMWAKETNSGLYSVDNIPLFARGVSPGDVIRVRKEDGTLIFDGVVNPSPSSVFRIFVSNRADVQAARDEFRKMGCESELSHITRLFAVEVPGTVDFGQVAELLAKGTETGRWEYEEGALRHSDVVFGLFRLLGYRFCPRLADIGGTRFWRIDPKADYGELNSVARQRVSLERVAPYWDDVMRLIGSLKLGRVSAMNIMRTLQVDDSPTHLAQAIAEIGRIDKTIHTLNFIDDETRRRSTLQQLNLGEGRHSLARDVFHGKRGELHQRYREGQEDQLSALGLVVNMIVLWNTIYMDAVLDQLRAEGYPVMPEDEARLSPFGQEHINMLGRYSFAVPEAVARCRQPHHRLRRQTVQRGRRNNPSGYPSQEITVMTGESIRLPQLR